MQHWAELTGHSVYAELTVFCVQCSVFCVLRVGAALGRADRSQCIRRADCVLCAVFCVLCAESRCSTGPS